MQHDKDKNGTCNKLMFASFSNPYPSPVYTGWSSVHWNAIGWPSVHWDTTGKT